MRQAHLKKRELTLVSGQYALADHLPQAKGALAETVRDWRRHGARVVPLPHPSPRNNLWLKRNPWFQKELLPVLRKRVSEVLKK